MPSPTAQLDPVTDLAEVLDVTHPTALTLLDLPLDERRAAAARAHADRRSALALYVALYAERYGHRLNLARVEAGDELLVELATLAVA